MASKDVKPDRRGFLKGSRLFGVAGVGFKPAQGGAADPINLEKR